ncbi:Peptidase-S8 domain-containing protein [Fusarium sp. LHS14.1]|nr:Peptidase-S8 domain-containing protein [Fusarium sp. LHS14.1]
MSDAEDRDPQRDSDDDEEETDEEDDLVKLAISDLKRTFDSEADEDHVDKFFRHHGETVKHFSEDGVTFLHRIVQLVKDKAVNAQHVRPLVERIFAQYPDHLKTRNDDGQTPLYQAIHLRRYTWKLVGYMLNSCSDPKCIEDALESPCGEGDSAKTCLTLAFEKDLRLKALQILVQFASDRALEAKDGSGRTPFHWAVQYSQCTDERVDVIKLLLEKDREAVHKLRETASLRPVDTFLDIKYVRREDSIEYSVYGEHERTAEVYLAEELARKEREARVREAKVREAEDERAETKTSTVNVAVRERESPKAGLRGKDPKAQFGPERDSGWKRPERDHDRRKPDADMLDERVLRVETGFTGGNNAPNTPLKRVATGRLGASEDKKRREKKMASSSKTSSKKPNPKVLSKNSAKILSILKLHYMRTRTIKMANSFLYGKNVHKDVQICFDYEGLPSEIQAHVFNERFGKDRSSGIQFDEVLMYVRFPDVTVIHSGRRAPKPRALGRQDMEFFFDWLYAKGVRRILKLEVEDSGKIPHSDEAIQISLDKIMIEHLDWQKSDLDPRVICNISSKADSSSVSDDDSDDGAKNILREVTLKWSGNNAVLRAWSEPEGLPQLQKLEVINLCIPPHSDVQKNLEEFRARLNKNVNLIRNVTTADVVSPGPEETQASTPAVEETGEASTAAPSPEHTIEVIAREGKKGTEIQVSSGSSKRSARTNPVTEHQWLTCMERFSGCMGRFWKDTIETSRERLGQGASAVDGQATADLERLSKDVVVALIDDGVDSCDPAFSGRAIEGKTFDYQDGGVGQFYISAKGHGTEMARMILKVCPMASIYSIRLKTHISPEKGHSTIDAASTAFAIEAALEKKASIISMSWTIPVPEDGSKEKQLLDAVLERACRQKVLMFCSSSDQINATEHYPSAYKRQRFFLIGAAHDDGSAYGHAGKDNDFIFPGVSVNTSGGNSLPLYLADKTSSTKESTGSSIATALAAGLAAMITYCFKTSALGIVSARTQQGKDYISGSELVKPGDVDKIAEHEVLKAAFSRFGNMENGQFIPVWNRFGPASDELEGEIKYESNITCVMNLCSNLIER